MDYIALQLSINVTSEKYNTIHIHTITIKRVYLKLEWHIHIQNTVVLAANFILTTEMPIDEKCILFIVFLLTQVFLYLVSFS